MSKKKNQIKNFPSDLKFPIKGSNSKFHIAWLLNFDKKFTSWPGKEGLDLFDQFAIHSIKIYCIPIYVFLFCQFRLHILAQKEENLWYQSVYQEKRRAYGCLNAKLRLILQCCNNIATPLEHFVHQRLRIYIRWCRRGNFLL